MSSLSASERAALNRQAAQQSLRFTSRMSISELAASVGATHRALRFYEERGLVVVGRRGSARYYDPWACERVRLIVVLRRAGLSIVQISALLAQQDASEAIQAAVVTHLEERLSQLETERSGILAALTWIAENPELPPRPAPRTEPRRETAPTRASTATVRVESLSGAHFDLTRPRPRALARNSGG